MAASSGSLPLCELCSRWANCLNFRTCCQACCKGRHTNDCGKRQLAILDSLTCRSHGLDVGSIGASPLMQLGNASWLRQNLPVPTARLPPVGIDAIQCNSPRAWFRVPAHSNILVHYYNTLDTYSMGGYPLGTMSQGCYLGPVLQWHWSSHYLSACVPHPTMASQTVWVKVGRLDRPNKDVLVPHLDRVEAKEVESWTSWGWQDSSTVVEWFDKHERQLEAREYTRSATSGHALTNPQLSHSSDGASRTFWRAQLVVDVPGTDEYVAAAEARAAQIASALRQCE
jgi:hypothetical protein